MTGVAGLLALSGLLQGGTLDDAHDVALLHDQEILAIDAYLGAGPLAKQHPVASLHVQRLDLAGLVAGAGAGGDDLALLGLLLGRVRDDDAALRLLLRVNAADNNPVVQRTELDGTLLSADVCRSCTWPSGTLIVRVPVSAEVNKIKDANLDESCAKYGPGGNSDQR